MRRAYYQIVRRVEQLPMYWKATRQQPRLRFSRIRRNRSQKPPPPAGREATESALISSDTSLPSEPGPGLRIGPEQRPSKNNVARWIPADRDFAPAFHACADHTIRIRERDAREEDPRFLLHFGFRANDPYVSPEGPHRVAVQLDDRS